MNFEAGRDGFGFGFERVQYSFVAEVASHVTQVQVPVTCLHSTCMHQIN